MFKSLLFVVMVYMASNGEMTFADFQLAVKWLCDISQHEDQWLLNYANCVVCHYFSFHSTLTSKWLIMTFSGLFRSFVLCGATMEAVARMLIHSTALRPITTRPSAHPQCVCSCLLYTSDAADE